MCHSPFLREEGSYSPLGRLPGEHGVGQEAGGGEGEKAGQEPLWWFPWEGMGETWVSALRISQFEELGRALGQTGSSQLPDV